MTSGSTRLLRWVERVAAATVAGFLGWFLVRHWREVSEYDWTVDWPRLALATATVLVAYSGFVLVWRQLLHAFGGRLSVADAHRIWYLGNLGRYVPGKVLQLAGTAYMARVKGVSPVITVAASLAAQVFVLGGGLIVAVIALPTLAVQAAPALRAAGLVLAVVFALVTLTPLFAALHRLALRFAGRVELYAPIPLRTRLVALVSNTALMALLGAGFHLFVTATTSAPRDEAPALIGIAATGYLAGYLAVFVPGGLVVREGVYAFLLTVYIPASVAVAVAILTRLWLTLCELMVVALLVARYGIADLRAPAEPIPRTVHG
jgi:uncharacterized membrane protein YbhN (UPF0104 family)